MKDVRRHWVFSVLRKSTPLTRKGFTLIEVLAASFILAILIGILLAVVVNVRTIFYTSDTVALLQSDARQAMSAIANELRRASKPQITITQNDPVNLSDSIRYHLPLDANGDGQPDLDGSGQTVWDTTNLVLRRNPAQLGILRKEIGVSSSIVIGRNVRRINFIDSTINPSLYSDEIQVTLELEKSDPKGITYSTALTSEINMRN